MRCIKSLMVAAGLTLSLAAGAKAEAANWFAAVDVRNPTGQTLRYQFRWGAADDWQNYTVEAGQVRTHFYGYAFADQNSSPIPQIRFHYNPGERVPDYKNYDLRAYAVPSRVVGCGMPYAFRYSPSGLYLDLYKE
jgi:hypothetical protein